MGTFTASLRAIGDVRGLPATVEIADGRMSIAAGSTHIGEWALADIHIEPIPTGYRVAAEGEQILVELKDIDGFADALAQNARKTRFRRKGLEPAKIEASAPASPKASPDSAPVAAPPAKSPREVKAKKSRSDRQEERAARTTNSRVGEPATRAKPKPEREGPSRLVKTMDGIIEAAERRWETLLPPWVFSRGIFLLLGIFLLMTIIFPGLSSAVLLILGGLLIVFGGIAYSDEIVASKWLPGRTSPAHPLIAGVALVILGVLVGMLAR